MKISSVLETCLYVRDLDVAEAFYANVIGLEFFKKVQGRHVFFRCGNQMFLLFNPEQTRQDEEGFPTHGSHGPGHVAFAVSATDFERWKQHLIDHSIDIEHEVVWPSGGRSVFFRDPSGNSVEFATPQTWLIEEV